MDFYQMFKVVIDSGFILHQNKPEGLICETVQVKMLECFHTPGLDRYMRGVALQMKYP
jgi:hypothetical protein